MLKLPYGNKAAQSILLSTHKSNHCCPVNFWSEHKCEGMESV